MPSIDLLILLLPPIIVVQNTYLIWLCRWLNMTHNTDLIWICYCLNMTHHSQCLPLFSPPPPPPTNSVSSTSHSMYNHSEEICWSSWIGIPWRSFRTTIIMEEKKKWRRSYIKKNCKQFFTSLLIGGLAKEYHILVQKSTVDEYVISPNIFSVMHGSSFGI